MRESKRHCLEKRIFKALVNYAVVADLLTIEEGEKLIERWENRFKPVLDYCHQLKIGDKVTHKVKKKTVKGISYVRNAVVLDHSIQLVDASELGKVSELVNDVRLEEDNATSEPNIRLDCDIELWKDHGDVLQHTLQLTNMYASKPFYNRGTWRCLLKAYSPLYPDVKEGNKTPFYKPTFKRDEQGNIKVTDLGEPYYDDELLAFISRSNRK
jgi:hypothetical protein